MTIVETPLYPRIDIQRRNKIIHQESPVYLVSFPSGADGWVPNQPGGLIQDPYASQIALVMKATGSLKKTITNLVVGKSYTITARVGGKPFMPSWRIKVSGITDLPPTQGGGWGWMEIDRTFTATSTSHTITFEFSAPDFYPVYFDFISITMKQWIEYLTPDWQTFIADAREVKISRGADPKGLVQTTDVGIMSFTLLNAEDPLDAATVLTPGDEITALVKLGTVEKRIFTGTLYDVKATYPFDKNTGTFQTVTVFTVLDAVSDHEKIQVDGRNGQWSEWDQDHNANRYGRPYEESPQTRMEALYDLSNKEVIWDDINTRLVFSV